MPQLREFAERLGVEVGEVHGREFSVAFVSDQRMSSLNSTFRGKEATTDVLSFPYEPDPFEPTGAQLGDIVISAEQAARQAEESGLTLLNEIEQLMLHGVLHLCGYDHESDSGEMEARELQLRDQLGI
jgi:probable rRNA maturation factor